MIALNMHGVKFKISGKTARKTSTLNKEVHSRVSQPVWYHERL